MCTITYERILHYRIVITIPHQCTYDTRDLKYTRSFIMAIFSESHFVSAWNRLGFRIKYIT